MNVCFYTSQRPSASNLLNIGYLAHQRPNHNYSFIQVAAAQENRSFKDRLKDMYIKARFNDGRFDFHKDSLLLENRLMGAVQPVKWSDFQCTAANAVNDTLSEDFLNKVQPDVIIQAGAGILKQNIFSKAKVATINLHHGIAPDIRGIHSTFWCMLYGIPEKIGVTCHFIDEHLDTGAVIMRNVLDRATGSFIDVQYANYLMGRDVLVNSMDILEKGNLKVVGKGQVKSYYFGVPDPFLYYAMKKRNFHPLMKIAQKTFKMKDLNVVEPL